MVGVRNRCNRGGETRNDPLSSTIGHNDNGYGKCSIISLPPWISKLISRRGSEHNPIRHRSSCIRSSRKLARGQKRPWSSKSSEYCCLVIHVYGHPRSNCPNGGQKCLRQDIQ